MKKVVLTGIKPTGIPHIGNYFGAIKPAIELSKNAEFDAFYFIADYHALNFIKDASELQSLTREIACTWLACGLDPEKVVFYQQSDIPEVTELAWILNNVTPKGLMNRAHAYKSAVDKAVNAGDDPDAYVNMGLFNYPILMAADILIMNSKLVPVGQDQKQHIEMARDIAKAFNKTYKNSFVIPEELIGKDVGTILGLDGRKMSKSYANTIPLFAPEEKLKKLIMSIKTDSSLPTEPKPLDSTVFNLFKLFASEVEIDAERRKYNAGLSWAEAKSDLFNIMNTKIKPMREKYEYYKSNYAEVEKLLAKGAARAREVAKETVARAREAVGIE